MSILSKREPPPPMPATVPMQPQPVRRKFSDAAALAAQHVIDLENQVESLQHERDEAVAQANAYKHMLDEYRNDLQTLTNERDWHKQRHVDMETTLQNAAAMIVNCYDRGRPKDQRLEQVAIDLDLTDKNKKPEPSQSTTP